MSPLPPSNGSAPPGPEPLLLTVADGPSGDAGCSYARLAPATLARLGARTGDILRLAGRGGAVLVARAMPSAANPGPQEVLLEAGWRTVVGLAVGETVSVQRLPTVAPALAVTLRPIGPGATLSPGLAARLAEGLPLVAGSRLHLVSANRRAADYEVIATVPATVVLCQAATRLTLATAPAAGRGAATTTIAAPTWAAIGGLRRELERIREIVELPLRCPEAFARLGIAPPRGVLLHGPPGTGKTLVARTVAAECGATFFTVNGPEIIHKYYGESERQLKDVFEKAAQQAPAIIFLDELDAIAPKRTATPGEVEKRVVATLLAQMDGLRDRGQVVVIGATNIPDALDPALRRPGRFDREVRLGVPDREGRAEILRIHTREMPLADDVALPALAALTPGFAGADLACLAREAALRALRRTSPEPGVGPTPEQLAELRIGHDDFREALRELRPASLREYVAEIPNVGWAQVGGLDDAKRLLQEAVVWPLRHPDLCAAAGVRPPKGILLEGPPGCGKTLLARALAGESGANFVAVNGPELFGRYVGETEAALREVFGTARAAAPCLLFLDEIDGLAGQREAAGDGGVARRAITQLLTEMDGVEELGGVVVLAATNRRDLLDPALLRTGRFDYHVAVTRPEEAARTAILQVHLQGRRLAPEVSVPALAAAAAGFSGSDLQALVQRAAFRALRRALLEGLPPVALCLAEADLREALAEVRREHRLPG